MAVTKEELRTQGILKKQGLAGVYMTEDYMNLTAPVFNVQTYSIHDGPGIRVTVFLKGCPLRCRWCANPESNLASPQLMTYSSKCTGCARCVPACEKNAVSIDASREKPHAVTDRTLCTDCGECVEVCLTEARELAGKKMTVAEVLKKVLRDKLFLDASGGGITVSGGECMMHPEFTEALLYAAKKEGLHTAIESCSFAPHEAVERVLRYTDLALLDIKHMDSAEHERLTGVPNGVILDNIRYIRHELGVPVIIRVPVIPGCNDSLKNISDTADFVKSELGEDVPVHLLPYHRLGESKSESLGRKMCLSIDVPGDEHMQTLKALVESKGLKAQIGG